MILNINKREKYLIIFTGIFVFISMVYQLGIDPLLENNKLLKKKMSAKKQILQDMVLLKAEYEQTFNKNDYFKKKYYRREKDFTLFGFLEKLSIKSGVSDNIVYIKPSSLLDKTLKIEFATVEIKLIKINLFQLISYLYLVETAEKMVFVKRLSIYRDGDNKGFINALLHVETIKSWKEKKS